MLLADIFTKVVDERAPVAFRAYDGSSAGPAGRDGRAGGAPAAMPSPTSRRRPATSASRAPT